MIGRSKLNVPLTKSGFTLIELLIAVLITAILAAAAFHFYVTMQQQVVTQQEISDMQQMSRSCLQEMTKTVRMAGYLVPGYPQAYRTNGDSLIIYYSFTDILNDVDSVTYFLEEFTATEYEAVPMRPAGMQIYKLMKQVGAGPPELFADYISSILYTEIPPSELAITLVVQASKGDDTFSANDGFRTFSNTERINMRNLSM